jgi:predicted DNA-binding helix-hairpin-helix protein
MVHGLGRWTHWKWWLHPLSARLRKNSLARLRTAEEVAIAAALGVRIDVNRASIDDWLRLPGLSIHQARTLVALVDKGNYFLCLEDIAIALGVSTATLQPLVPILQFCYYDV